MWRSISRAASVVTRSSTLPDLLADAAWQLLGDDSVESFLGDQLSGEAGTGLEGAGSGGTPSSASSGAASLGLSSLMCGAGGCSVRFGGAADAGVKDRACMRMRMHARSSVARRGRWLVSRGQASHATTTPHLRGP